MAHDKDQKLTFVNTAISTCLPNLTYIKYIDG